ncbi:hypothetical protein Q8F57_000490 [Paraburkholderia terrae]|uniref:hypothetical protein n=1 Tax=Paraburkholderia terrae TaxID=311230 RepID=UPI00296B10BA|nr:hypothetical protein [Paraburkholderia terrae]MDW3660594.1 hypothetical protein [Paraburkholderia terrae]
MDETTFADQPPLPGNECVDLPTTPPPKFEPTQCPDHDPDCNCPAGPKSGPNCLENLIAAQAAQISAAEKAKTFKTSLEALLGKANAATLDYTREKYDKLLKQWKEEDGQIEKLIRNFVCAVPCWRCIIECHICPLINKIRDAEQSLYAGAGFYTSVEKLANIYDYRYWLEQDAEAKRRRFERISNVLAAWEKPGPTIDKALSDNAKLISDLGALPGAAPKAVYDLFLRLIPLHLAISPPPSSADLKTKIAAQYTKFCCCDSKGTEMCCGVYVGEPTVRERLVGTQPFLIDPNAYLDLVCCLVSKRYTSAKDAFATATAELERVDDLIKRSKVIIDDGIKNLEKDAKNAIPAAVDCTQYKPVDKETRTC